MDREVKYRVNKYILRLLVQHNIISKAEIRAKIKKLTIKFNNLKIKLLIVLGIINPKIFPFSANEIFDVSWYVEPKK